MLAGICIITRRPVPVPICFSCNCQGRAHVGSGLTLPSCSQKRLALWFFCRNQISAKGQLDTFGCKSNKTHQSKLKHVSIKYVLIKYFCINFSNLIKQSLSQNQKRNCKIITSSETIHIKSRKFNKLQLNCRSSVKRYFESVNHLGNKVRGGYSVHIKLNRTVPVPERIATIAYGNRTDMTINGKEKPSCSTLKTGTDEYIVQSRRFIILRAATGRVTVPLIRG